MLMQPPLEQLHAMRLTGMADAAGQPMENTEILRLSVEQHLPCWWIGNGTGRKIGRSTAALTVN